MGRKSCQYALYMANWSLFPTRWVYAWKTSRLIFDVSLTISIDRFLGYGHCFKAISFLWRFEAFSKSIWSKTTIRCSSAITQENIIWIVVMLCEFQGLQCLAYMPVFLQRIQALLFNWNSTAQHMLKVSWMRVERWVNAGPKSQKRVSNLGCWDCSNYQRPLVCEDV